MSKSEVIERPQSLSEEIANTINHGAGLAAAVVGALVLIITAVQRGNVSFILGASVFAVTMVLLYLASTLYHSPLMSRAKSVFLVCDHAVIYIHRRHLHTVHTRHIAGWVGVAAIWLGVDSGGGCHFQDYCGR